MGALRCYSGSGGAGDFTLSVTPGNIEIPIASSGTVTLNVDRTGSAGDIVLAAQNVTGYGPYESIDAVTTSFGLLGVETYDFTVGRPPHFSTKSASRTFTSAP